MKISTVPFGKGTRWLIKILRCTHVGAMHSVRLSPGRFTWLLQAQYDTPATPVSFLRSGDLEERPHQLPPLHDRVVTRLVNLHQQGIH